MPLRIQYVMQFFPGEGSPGSLQPSRLAALLARRGHDVTVIAADYNIDSNQAEPVIDRAEGEGRLRVLRLPTPRGGRGRNLERLVAYVSFMRAAQVAARGLARPDVVVGSVQPMFAGRAAHRSARRAGVPFVLEVRDLWPDALVAKGVLRPWQAWPLARIMDRLYREAVRIVSLTPGIKKEIVAKGIAASKIDVFPNGFDPALFQGAAARREEVRRRYGWGEDFVAIYTGSFQAVTAVDVFVHAAEQLVSSPGVRIALFGAGPTREAVGRLAVEKGLRNVEFHAPVPKTEVPALLAAADVGLMALFRSPLIHIYFENKLMDYMGSGLPIVAAFEGEQARVIREHETGRVVGTFDSAGLGRGLLALRAEPEALRRMGANGRRLVGERLLLPQILERYACRIEDCAAGRESTREAWEPL